MSNFSKAIIFFGCILSFMQSTASDKSNDFTNAKVIHVADGDTVTILTSKYQQYIIRLYGIDAPENGQAYGKKSKQLLSKLVKGKVITARCFEQDKYQRHVCTLIDSNGEDINQAMVSRGGAWVYRKYYTGTKYYWYEATAKQNKRGLWSIPDAQPPWEWRQGSTIEPNAAPVKLSRSKICHAIGSKYYNRVKRYKRFSNIEECLKYGRLPKR